MSSEVAQGFAASGIQTLHTVLDPSALGQSLLRVLPARWGALQNVQCQVLKHHRMGRCTVNITLQTTAGERELIGKVYSSNRADVYQAMKEINQSGFGPKEDFSIPQPLAYIPALNLLLLEKIQGQPATEIFLKESEHERAKAAERCAEWLANFHAHSELSQPVFVLTQHLLEQWANRIMKSAESLSEKAQLLCKRLDEAPSLLAQAEMCSGHGGYCHQQIIVAGERVVTLDWDNYCFANPARDVARFIVELQQLALKTYGLIEALDPAIEAFFKTYSSLSRLEINPSLPFYKAAICLKRAKAHLRSRGAGAKYAAATLEEGLRVLATEV